MVRTALAAGARILTPGQVRWDVSGGCLHPFMVTIEGRDPAFMQSQFQDNAVAHAQWWGDGFDGKGSYPAGPIWLDIMTPCRKCKPCLKRRSARWAYRARCELALAKRTWFATFTADPDHQYVFECRAAAAVGARGDRWGLLSPEDRFKALAAEFGKELTLYFKRIRKNTGIPLRYILVAEAHVSGLPHFHALIHEITDERITWRELDQAWTIGHSMFKLTDGDRRAAQYVCKYLAKAALARVRASKGYGKLDPVQQASIAQRVKL